MKDVFGRIWIDGKAVVQLIDAGVDADVDEALVTVVVLFCRHDFYDVAIVEEIGVMQR